MKEETEKRSAEARVVFDGLQAALTHYQHGRWIVAEHACREVLKIVPDHADALHLLGVISRQNGQLTQAIEFIQRALVINPVCAKAHSNLGMALKEANQIEAAVLCYQQALKLEPDLPEAHYNLGIIFSEQNKLEAAAACYQKALKYRPSYVEAFNNLGIVFKQQGKPREAVVCHEQAIKLKPDYIEAYNNLGIAFRALGLSDKAIASYRQVIKLQPDHFAANNNLANVMQEQGRFDEALEIYIKVLGCDPNSYEAHNNLGVIFEERREYQRAHACYQRSLELNPDYAEAHNNYANLVRSQGRVEEAVACYQKAHALRPDNIAVLSNLGNALKEAGEIDAAITASQTAWSMDPNGFSGLVSAIRLAVLYYLKNNKVAVEETLEMSKNNMTVEDVKFVAPREYWGLLHRLMQDKTDRDVDNEQRQKNEQLFVIGESHMLSVHNLTLSHASLQVDCTGLWIEGCKQWHLAKKEENSYKYQLRKILKSIPHQANVLLIIGEIDCRIDEGILPAWKKSTGKQIEDFIEGTVVGYLNYVEHLAAEFDQQFIICGVPAPQLQSKTAASENEEMLLMLIAHVNNLLRTNTLKKGWRFLDVYALTNSGDGVADGRWHLDRHHLRPEAYVNAFEKHLMVP